MNLLKTKVSRSFPALLHKNFRFFWCGQCISLLGTWIQRTAQMWLVYSLTNSAFLVGVLGACQFLPQMFFSLFAGVFVDKVPKRTIIICTQIILMIQAFTLALLTWSGSIRYWHLIILSLIMGFVNTVDMPARQSFFIELVGKEHLMNAIALNSSIFNLARILGPAVSGVLMTYTNIPFCFLLNALSFIAVLYGLFKIDVIGKPKLKNSSKNVISDIASGLKYIKSNTIVFSSVIMMLVVCTFAMNNDVIIPVFAKVTLHQREQGYSILLSCMGVGSFIGAISMATKSKKGPKIKILIITSVVVSIILMLGIGVNSYISSALIFALIGYFNLIFLTTANSLIQLNSIGEYRGRVMSVYSLVNAGTTPIGNVYAGFFDDKFGPNVGLFSCGAATLIFSLITILSMKKKLMKLTS